MEPQRTIFLTGFPGFIAGRLVERLAADSVEFYLLIQPSFIEAAKLSVESIARRTGVPLERFTIVPGDITQSSLGISDEDFATIAADVTDVFHLAAVYDLAVSKETAFQVNVKGTENVSAAARRFKKLRAYNYISTCYVAGKRTGEIYETELEHTAGFRNYYEETKYLAEVSVERLKGELPVTIFRPSVVVGDSETGETVKYDGIYALILFLLKAPGLLRFVNVGNKDVRLNLVPVDFVVESLAALSADPASIGKTIALADPEPLATSQIFDVLAAAMTGRKSVVQPPAALVERALMLPLSPPLTGLPHAGVPYFFLPQTYDTAIATKLLAAHGIACPRFEAYAPRLVDFVRKHPKL